MTIQRTFHCAVCILCTLLLPSGYSQLEKEKGSKAYGLDVLCKERTNFSHLEQFGPTFILNAKMIIENAAFSKRV